MATKRSDIGEVRDDFVPASDYISKEFAELENERLWPRVWQMACREEDIPEVGDFHTYEIVDESIVLVRTAPDEVKGFFNVCPHRGNRLAAGCGHIQRFRCTFHGWQFNLDGTPHHVVDRDDWGGRLDDEEITLTQVKVAHWAGWIYINMDPDCEPLETFLGDAKGAHDPIGMEKLRYHWKKSAIVPCNWKTVLGMFNEAYHLQATHSQMLPYWDDYTASYARGRHSTFRYEDTLPPGLPSKRLGKSPEDVDIRVGLADYIKDMDQTLWTSEAVLMAGTVDRLVEEVPREADWGEVLMKLGQFTIEDLAAKGIESPILTPEQIAELGSDWHIFPNHIMISSANAVLAYRARPNGHDPDSAIWDVYSLLRYPPGEEPEVEHEWCNDLSDEEAWPKVLRQDFANMVGVQQGMKSRAFKGSRTNPKQEVPVSHLHRTLREFMGL
jgi:nitrite reductase/ring-hydroxylating ferredoxin subunit